MEFIETPIKGAYIIRRERGYDRRGYFSRIFCIDEFRKGIGQDLKIVQCNESYNFLEGTVRGMHYQLAPFEEEKIVWCSKGKIYDVILDLRSGDTGTWFNFILDDHHGDMLYIPKGVAHGYQTLTESTTVNYMVTAPYSSEHARVIPYNRFGIVFPLDITSISERDKCQ